MSFQDVTRRSFLETSLLATAGAGLALTAANCTGKPQSAVTPVVLGDGEKLKVGIIGCGNRSQSHIRAMNAHDRIEIAALCDILPEMMEQKKQQIEGPEPALYTDWNEMLKRDDLHAVTIVLPNNLHKDSAVACFEAGKHVLCEKPLALNITDARTMIDAGEKAGKALQVSTQGMHSPSTQVVGKQVHAGAIGNLLYAWIQTFRGDWRKLDPDPKKDSQINWRMNKSLSGGITFEQGIHTLAAFNWFIDSEPVELVAMGGYHNKKLEERDSYDHAGIMVRYANGLLMTYGGNNYACSRPDANFLYGDVGTLEVSGKPVIQKRTYTNPYGGTPRPDPNREEIAIDVPRADGSADVLQYRHFFEAVQGKKVPFPSGRDHLPALQIAVGSMIATAEKRFVTVSEIA